MYICIYNESVDVLLYSEWWYDKEDRKRWGMSDERKLEFFFDGFECVFERGYRSVFVGIDAGGSGSVMRIRSGYVVIGETSNFGSR